MLERLADGSQGPRPTLPKGGLGKTTIAYELAWLLGGVLIDIDWEGRRHPVRGATARAQSLNVSIAVGGDSTAPVHTRITGSTSGNMRP